MCNREDLTPNGKDHRGNIRTIGKTTCLMGRTVGAICTQ